MTEAQLRDLIRDHARLLLSSEAGTVLHAISVSGIRAGMNHALCGIWVSTTPETHSEAYLNTFRLCQRCLLASLYRGWLHPM